QKIFQVRCTYKPCGKIYYLFASSPFTNNFFLTNCQIFLILKYWLSGSNKMKLADPLEILRYSIYRILRKKSKKTNIIDKYYQQVISIGMFDIIVEVDESNLGKMKYKRGHVGYGIWILGAVERTSS
ncbi:hypothetical protein DMUE_5743, partial [Dictyocoela muelleri]